MLLQGKLNKHLNQIDWEAREQIELLVKQMAERQRVTEKLKAEDQIKWCGLMNNIWHCAEEIVLEKIVYV